MEEEPLPSFMFMSIEPEVEPPLMWVSEFQEEEPPVFQLDDEELWLSQLDDDEPEFQLEEEPEFQLEEDPEFMLEEEEPQGSFWVLEPPQPPALALAEIVSPFGPVIEADAPPGPAVEDPFMLNRERSQAQL